MSCAVKGCRKPEGGVGILPKGCTKSVWLCEMHFKELAEGAGSMCENVKEKCNTNY